MHLIRIPLEPKVFQKKLLYKLEEQKKGTLLAFTAIMFITPDSLLIRLSNVESWNLIFYRGFIPFFVVFIGLLIIKRSSNS